MSVRSLVLGLDVSPRRLGWGLVDLLTGEAVACGMEPIDLPDHEWSHERTRDALERVNSRAHIRVTSPQTWMEIQAVYIECPISRFPGMAYNEGRAVGLACGEVQRRWPWVQFDESHHLKPGEWRKLAGLKGNASKQDVWFAATALLLTEYAHSQDAADALLIAVAGQRRNLDTFERSEAAA